jgi:hypothetical protein
MDRTQDGKAFRIVTIIDQYTRKFLDIVVGRSPRSLDVVDARADLFVKEGRLRTSDLRTVLSSARRLYETDWNTWTWTIVH